LPTQTNPSKKTKPTAPLPLISAGPWFKDWVHRKDSIPIGSEQASAPSGLGVRAVVVAGVWHGDEPMKAVSMRLGNVWVRVSGASFQAMGDRFKDVPGGCEIIPASGKMNFDLIAMG
jgi:hypothetical protein